MQKQALFQGQDPRDMPGYCIPAAAHYIQMPPSTLRSWIKGWRYQTEAGLRASAPLLIPPPASRPGPILLSFLNLVEAHVLSAIRREHRISMIKVREALDYLQQTFPVSHPLANQRFATDGIHFFIERYGQLINISQAGQLALHGILRVYLSRIEWDSTGVPNKLYLFTRAQRHDGPKLVAIDPYVAFGRPVLVHTGIPTAIIAERYKAGESMTDLAQDYGRPQSEMEEAIRCEMLDNAA